MEKGTSMLNIEIHVRLIDGCQIGQKTEKIAFQLDLYTHMYIEAEKQYILRSCHVSQTQPNKKKPRIYTYTVCIEVYAD